MKSFYVVINKGNSMRELHSEATSFIGRVGAVISNKELTNSPSVSIGDVLYCPLTGFNWEVVVIK